MQSESIEVSGPLLFYDGHCALCNGAVSFILKYDSKHQFNFAALTGQTAKAHLESFPELAEMDSLILWDKQKNYTRSSAALRVCMILGGFWKTFAILYIIPKFIRDWVYDGIARVRYKWFGKYDACPLPPAEWRTRFKP